MGGRDHSCEVCGRGGFNGGVCECPERCPTCGQAVKVFTGSEGTSSFEKLAERQLEEAREALLGMVDQLHGGDQESLRDCENENCKRVSAALARLSSGEEGTG